MDSDTTYQIYNAIAAQALFGEKKVIIYQDLTNSELITVPSENEQNFLQELGAKDFEFTEIEILIADEFLSHKWLGAKSGYLDVFKIKPETDVKVLTDTDQVADSFGYSKKSDEFIVATLIFE